MVVVSAVTLLALWLADRNLSATIERELQQAFQAELSSLHQAQALRHAALVERCRALVRKPRIHAALEDNALDLLYLSAEDELRDVLTTGDGHEPETGPALRARFYRFLDRDGAVIPPPLGSPTGQVPFQVEAQLALPQVTRSQHVGYVVGGGFAGGTEVIATPIVSHESGEPIAALVLGFRPLSMQLGRHVRSGVWVNGELHLAGPAAAEQRAIAAALPASLGRAEEGREAVSLDGAPHLLFYKRLNPGSLYPPAYEVSVFALDGFADRRMQRRLQILGAGLALLLGALVASRWVAMRLSAPVEKLAADSERSARFAADASHQLKTPVTVLRAGLEELLARPDLPGEEARALEALVFQTYRLSSLVDDLLLLSRMDSGRLKLTLAPVHLSGLIEAALDDLSAIPDKLNLTVETELGDDLWVLGERRYTEMILHNLLENARKYNRPGGRIRIVASRDENRGTESPAYLSEVSRRTPLRRSGEPTGHDNAAHGEVIVVRIGNTGAGIDAATQAHIFEPFHRGKVGENLPGHGLGLNLARELARLHDGELRLLGTGNDWTEFEVRFRAAIAARVGT